MKYMAQFVKKFLIFLAFSLSFVTVPVMGYSSFQVTENVTNPLAFSFSLLSSPPVGITVSTLRYDFGDGESSNKENSVHIYKKPGTYSPSLTIIWSDSKGIHFTTTTTATLVAGNVSNTTQGTKKFTVTPTVTLTQLLKGTAPYIPTPYKPLGPLPSFLPTITRAYTPLSVPTLTGL